MFYVWVFVFVFYCIWFFFPGFYSVMFCISCLCAVSGKIIFLIVFLPFFPPSFSRLIARGVSGGGTRAKAGVLEEIASNLLYGIQNKRLREKHNRGPPGASSSNIEVV